MNKAKNKITSLEDFINEHYGAIGSEKRNEYQEDAEAFTLGFQIREARIKQNLTQEQLAEKIGINKSTISKVENDVRDVRVSTLQKILKGLGCHLSLSIAA